ncbi:MAG: class I SAM-dependent methyltransferase [Deltaproteobacteria bacterium]|nr:class I SAM-dependent methyltransferase [Deltaproteobacteria bacterium]
MSDQTLSRSYYDEFSENYERHRHEGYHTLIDDLEVDLARRYCHGRILEAGCGSGLILRRLAVGAKQAVGLDLSSGMLRWAARRGLSVAQGSVDALPFPDEHFDGVVSFKVLAHVPPIERALAELARVTRPGGHLVLEFYNRHSLRTAIKRLKAPTSIGSTYTDDDVFTRYDALDDVKRYLPPSVEFVAVHGVRVFTPVASIHKVPVLRDMFAAAERIARDAPLLRQYGGFMVVVARKRH